jgi:hypothetical protein
MIRLPVSGEAVLLRLPDGADEMAIAEDDAAPIQAALRLLGRAATPAEEGTADWSRLPVADFEVLLLHLRETVLGGTIASDIACPACREPVEVSFRIDDFIAAVRPSVPRDVAPDLLAGWFALAGARFRLPLVADLLAVRDAASPGAALRARCLDAVTPARLRPRIERAIARMAPEVSGPVGGACPGCGATVEALFNVPGFVVAELRRQAAEVYADVHKLAGAYGWSEAAILALPGARRRRYAELVREADVAGVARGSWHRPFA